MIAFDASLPAATVFTAFSATPFPREHVFFSKSYVRVFEKAVMPCYISENRHKAVNHEPGGPL